MPSAREKRMNAFRKKVDSDSYVNSKFGLITHWLSAGDYGFNRLLSGSIYKGIPNGKIVQFAGESQTGKSLIAALAIINALKDGYDTVFYVDAEGGMVRSFVEEAGVDLSRIEIIPVKDVEDCHVKVQQAFEMIRDVLKDEDPDAKFLFVVDSLGAMVSNKVISDATDKKRMAGDMGLTAKVKNTMLKSWVVPCGMTGASMILINHVYDDPNAMYPSKIKNIGGGKQTQFMPHITVQCSKTLEKKDDKDADQEFKGTVLKFFTVKNRCCKSFHSTEMYLDYNNGFQKWFSLFKPAIQLGFIKKTGSWYEVPSYGEKKMRGSEILNTDEIWEGFLEEFDKKSLERLSYSTPVIMDEESMDEYVDSIVAEPEMVVEQDETDYETDA
jgi:recombination protein RecA